MPPDADERDSGRKGGDNNKDKPRTKTMTMIKKGDKVRFLFATGGGTVAAVKGNIVMVEDADGFQIPTPINEVVLDASQEQPIIRVRLRQPETSEFVDLEDFINKFKF